MGKADSAADGTIGRWRRLETEEHRLANNVLEPERAREELLREEKLAVMGRLSNSIAHEIRDPGTMVCFSLHLLSNQEIQAR